METHNCQAFRPPIRKMSAMSAMVIVCVLLIAAPGVCISPQPSAKQANEVAALHQAGLNKNRTQIPALLAALKKPQDPTERSSTFIALHALARMGATEALPAINSLTSTSHDVNLVNFAAAKARLLAESGTQAIKDPKARARAMLAALYQQTKLTPDALNQDAKYYQARIGNPGEPVPLGVCLMREAADVLYQEGVASAAVEATPPGYSLDFPAALKVQMAPLSLNDRINALVKQLVHRKITQQDERHAIQLLADMGGAAEQAVDTKLVDMDLHQEEYSSDDFAALFDVLRGIGDASQTSLVQDFARDPTREAADGAAGALADVSAGRKLVLVVGY